MVDFSFIVSLYVSDLPNVTISTRSCSCTRTARNTISRVILSPYSEEQCEAQPRTALRNTYYREIVILAVQLPTSSMTATFQYNLHLRTNWDVLVVTYRSSTGLSRPGLVPTADAPGRGDDAAATVHMQQIKSQSLTEYSIIRFDFKRRKY